MSKITLRYHKLSNAKRFYEILNNPHFIYFTAKPKSIVEEKKWIKGNPQRRKNNSAWNYAILSDGKLIGGIGIKINFHRQFIGEIGYFLDEAYWGQGITTKAVKLAEKEGFCKLGLMRIEILMEPKNKASERVAVKCGYKKEGLLKKSVVGAGGQKKDALLYAKVL